jgi:hypothetical protein
MTVRDQLARAIGAGEPCSHPGPRWCELRAADAALPAIAAWLRSDEAHGKATDALMVLTYHPMSRGEATTQATIALGALADLISPPPVEEVATG